MQGHSYMCIYAPGSPPPPRPLRQSFLFCLSPPSDLVHPEQNTRDLYTSLYDVLKKKIIYLYMYIHKQ